MATSSLLGYTITLSPPLLIALRIAPLLSTTASMTHAYMEYLAMSSFLPPPNTNTRLAQAMIAAAPPSTTKESTTIRESSTAAGPQRKTAPTKKEVTAAENLLVPRWFVSLFSTGLYSVIGLNSLTLLSSFLNVFLVPGGSRPLGLHRKYYLTGLVAAVAHYAFVPLVGRSVGALFAMCDEGERKGGGGKEVVKGEEEGRAKGWVREWVGWHVVRWGTVDLVAWGSFAVGVVGGLV